MVAPEEAQVVSEYIRGTRCWEFDPDADPAGGLLHAAGLLDYWRGRGIRFTVAGRQVTVQEPRDRVGQLLTSEDLMMLGMCQDHLRALLVLEARGTFNLGLADEVPRDLQDSATPGS